MKKIFLLLTIVLSMFVGLLKAQTSIGPSITTGYFKGNLNTIEFSPGLAIIHNVNDAVVFTVSGSHSWAKNRKEYGGGYATSTKSLGLLFDARLDLNVNPLFNEKKSGREKVFLSFYAGYQSIGLTYIADNTEYVEMIGKTYRKTTPVFGGGFTYRYDFDNSNLNISVLCLKKMNSIDRDPTPLVGDEAKGSVGGSITITYAWNLHSKKTRRNGPIRKWNNTN